MSLLRSVFSILIISLIFSPALYAGGLQGIVTDAESGTPLADAQIHALTFTAAGDSLLYSAKSGADGQYQINNMGAYAYLVWCEHTEFLTIKKDQVIISENANLALNFSLHQYNHPLYDTRVSGIVYSTPEMLPAFIPLPGATVMIQNDDRQYQTKTANDGSYIFQYIPPGEYKLSAVAPNHQPFEFPDLLVVTEGVYSEININLVPLPYPNTSTVFGKITESGTNMPVYPAYVTMIPLVYFLTDGPVPIEPEIYAVINNPDGSYIVENIPAGDYMMICSATTHKWQRIEKVSLDDVKVQVDFYLEKLDPTVSNLISGTIYEYPTRGKVLPLVDVYLSFIDPGMERPEILHHCLSDGFGHYQFHDFYSGQAVLQFSKPFYEPLQDTLSVAADTWLTNQDYSLKPVNQIEPIVLRGYVYQQSVTTELHPVYPAHVQLYTVTSSGKILRYDTVNKPDGSYMISGIRPGTYTVVCAAMGYEKQVESNLVLSEPSHQLNFYLKPIDTSRFGKISGHVYFDRLNQPVAGALISFLPRYTDLLENDAAYFTRTGIDGAYQMNLPAGEYIVSCQYRDPNGWYYYQEYYDNVHRLVDATPVKIQAGLLLSGINFGIPFPAIVSSVTVQGHVSDADGQPLADAVVNVRPFDLIVRAYGFADNVYQTRTNNEGNYILQIDLYWLTIPTPVLGFIVSAGKQGFVREFYEEKKTAYEADILWAFSDTTFSDIDFTLDPLIDMYAIQGKISSENGTDIARAFIVGVHAASGEVAFAVSDLTGMYHLDGLKRGYYFLLFVASGYRPEFYDDVHHWEEATPVWVDGTVTGIDAALEPLPVLSGDINGVVGGRVCDREGNPLAGAMVTMQIRNGPVSGYSLTDNEGMFQIPWDTAGDYLITISKVNYGSYDTWINVNTADAPATSLSFNLESTFTDLPEPDDAVQDQTVPSAYRLYGNYPNPFNPLTHIVFDLPKTENVSLVIYDILGHRVRELLNENLSTGKHVITWDATDQQGIRVASGIYFYILQTPSTRLVGKMILQK